MPALPRTRHAHSPVHDTPRVSTPPTIWGQGIQFVKEDDAGSSCPGSGKHWEETESTRDEKSRRSNQQDLNGVTSKELKSCGWKSAACCLTIPLYSCQRGSERARLGVRDCWIYALAACCGWVFGKAV